MKTGDFFLFIVLQFILPRGQTSVLNATERASFDSTAAESATVDTFHPGCEYNGVQYNHSERLPGCFKVYCIQGEWLQRGYIDWNCMFCSAYWDPHFVTFDRWFYDFQGPCDYALAQEGTSRTPRYAVNTKFIECSGGASCVGPSTFKDSEKTLIEMGAFGWGAPDLFKLKVNGVLYEVPDPVPRLVKEGMQEHPVFAWRYNNCVRLLGSSKIAVEKCGTSLAIWASPEFHGSLFGLCGFYDGNTSNDFVRRDGTVSSMEQFPKDFPSSWEIKCPSENSQTVTKSTAEDESTNCTLDEKLKEELRNRCNKTVGRTQGLLTEDLTAVLMENCFFDLCSILTNTSGNSDVIETWLGEIESSITEISDAANKIRGTDILPEAAKDNQLEPTTNGTAINSDLVTTVLTGSIKNLTNSSTDLLPEAVDDNEQKGTTKRTGISTNSVQAIAAVSTGSNKNIPDLRIGNSPKPVEEDKQEAMTIRTSISTDSTILLPAVSPGPNRNLPDSGIDKLPEPVEDEQKATTNGTGIPSDFDTTDAAVSIRSDTYHTDSSTDILQEPLGDEVDVMNNGTGISFDSLTPIATVLPGANRNLPDLSRDTSPEPIEDELESTTNGTGIHSDLDISDTVASAGSNRNDSDSSTDISPKTVKHRKLGVTTDGTGINIDSLTPVATVLPGPNRNLPHSSRDALADPVKDELESTTNGIAIRSDMDTSDATASKGSNRNLPDSNKVNSPVPVEDDGLEATTDGAGIGLITDSVEVVLTGPNKDLPDSNESSGIWRIVINIIHGFVGN